MNESIELIEKVETVQNMLIARATAGTVNENDYATLRLQLLNNDAISSLLPSFLRTCRNISQFWSFIKYKFPSYQERRDYIWSEFREVLDFLELRKFTPSDEIISEALSNFDQNYIHEVWQKALKRRLNDAEGAITMARTLLESVCKHILDEFKVEYDGKTDLPKLYGLTIEKLNLAPSQHSEQVFKQILGGCQIIVNGLCSLRNNLSDAHGKGKLPAKPAARHAELSVNLAGTMATFLIATFENNKSKITF